MRRIRCAVAIAAAATVGPLSATAQVPDTTVSFRGIVMRDTGSSWGLFLPVPAQVGRVRFNFLHLAGSLGRIDRDENRYAELRGKLQADDAGHPMLAVGNVKLMNVPGEGDRSVQRTFMEHAEVTVGILPNKIVYADSASSGRTRPVITYAITNHSDAPIDFSFHNNKVICASVLPSDRSVEPIWTGAWTVGPYLTSLQISLSATVREAVTIPDSVTFAPGHYKLRVWLCEVTDYSAETTFEVAAQ